MSTTMTSSAAPPLMVDRAPRWTRHPDIKEAPAWSRMASMAFTASHGGLAPSTLSVLEYNALSPKVDLPLAIGCAAGTAGPAHTRVKGSAARLLEHRPDRNWDTCDGKRQTAAEAAKHNARTVTRVYADGTAPAHYLREPATIGMANPHDTKGAQYFMAKCFAPPHQHQHQDQQHQQHGHGGGGYPMMPCMPQPVPLMPQPVALMPPPMVHYAPPPQPTGAWMCPVPMPVGAPPAMGPGPPMMAAVPSYHPGHGGAPCCWCGPPPAQTHPARMLDHMQFDQHDEYLHVSAKGSWDGRFGGPFREVDPATEQGLRDDPRSGLTTSSRPRKGR